MTESAQLMQVMLANLSPPQDAEVREAALVGSAKLLVLLESKEVTAKQCQWWGAHITAAGTRCFQSSVVPHAAVYRRFSDGWQ